MPVIFKIFNLTILLSKKVGCIPLVSSQVHLLCFCYTEFKSVGSLIFLLFIVNVFHSLNDLNWFFHAKLHVD